MFVWQIARGAELKPAAPQGSPARLAPAFALPDLDGRSRSLESFRGRPLLVNFWATWCPPCRAELPELQAAWLAHQSCFDVVGITVDSGTADDVRAFARARGIGYPVLLDDGSAGRAYGIANIPRSFLLDAQGRLVGTFNGAVTRGGIERALSSLATPAC
ncbi:MAG TPA: TlpA disulfide reductase family protein [Myxococcales bacterium]|nr:TlpA disulfide reductase family protein [Myxococcales bacterium]